MRKTHGLSRHPLYSVWSQMMGRCHNPKHAMFKWYGGRGIAVAERWHDVERFVSDLQPRPAGMTLERINNDGPYTPENCRWATRSEQARNRAPMGTYMTTTEQRRWKSSLKKRMKALAARPHPERRLQPQTCPQCGNPFVRHGGYQEQTHCSSKCYGASVRARAERACAVCGVTFYPRTNTQQFCSRACRGISQRK